MLANVHRPFAVAAAIVFAGKPAPTLMRIGGWARGVVGFAREEASTDSTHMKTGPFGPVVHYR